MLRTVSSVPLNPFVCAKTVPALYIHIPLCHAKCAYCDFYSLPERRYDHQVIIDTLLAEYRLRRDLYSRDARWDTVYLGGGTPSIVEPELLRPLLAETTRHATEVTIEVNPEDVSEHRVRQWLDMGINRVSMGVQSFVDSELKAVGRRHTGADALNAVSILRQAGCKNISLDLIYGLPNQTLDTLRLSLDTLMKLRPEHLSCYCLSYEPGTRLYAALTANRLTPTDEDTLVKMYSMVCEHTARCGYSHYEVSNFALPGYHSRHNSSYWDSTPYLGLGPSAHSWDGINRSYNPTNLKSWMTAIQNGAPAAIVEDMTDTERANDIIFTRLRTARGLALDELPPRFRGAFMDAVAKLPAGSLVRQTADSLIDGKAPYERMVIPHEKWLISDAIIRDLML